MKVLVVGYGNPLRSDDGVGPYVARKIESLNLPGVETRTPHQLNPELSDDIARFDLVFLIDASQDGLPVHIRRTEGNGAGRPSTHHFAPESLLRLAKAIGERAPEIMLCSVRGENFEFGDALSDAALQRAEEAAGKIGKILMSS